MIEGYSSLPPKPPPVSAWMTRACSALMLERLAHRLVDVVGALERAVDGDAAILAGHRDHRVVLDVELLLVADPVLALEDDVGLGEARLEVAPADLVLGEHVIRGLDGSKTGGRGSVTRRIAAPAGGGSSPGPGAARRATGSAWWRISPPTGRGPAGPP